jgi:CRISPR-associated endonuclease/helicase Cas3
MEYYAHTSSGTHTKTTKTVSDKRNWQLLSDHLNNVAELAEETAGKFGFAKTASLAAYLHDMGKFSRAFCDYLENENGKRGDIIHSTQGAMFINEIAGESALSRITALIIALVTANHHGGLSDIISPSGETPFDKRLSEIGDKFHYDEVKTNYANEYPNILSIFPDAIKELEVFSQKKYNNSTEQMFALQMIIKLIFSAIVDADRYDTYLFEINKIREPFVLQNWNYLSEKLENSLNKLAAASSENAINIIRKAISDSCREAANRNQGVYLLDVPTGGGKTLSSLRFAINHAEKYGLHRIIYVIPYLSIIDQTAKEIRDKLGVDSDDFTVLEHHSDISMTDENEAQVKLLTSRWDSPIIVTSMVQFLESIFTSRSGNLRKLHNMTHSLIIFDEIQNLPLKCTYLFNQAINFLTDHCGNTVLLCSATQPIFDQTKSYKLKISDNPSLIDNKNTAKIRDIKRTEIKYCGDMTASDTANLARGKFEAGLSTLVIVNTRKTAVEIFQNLKDVGAYHLSTSMCREHRATVIDKIKNNLAEKIPVICISTQLIEAGVDISFGCVIRSLAGLDSIAQAAGRCNRNGEFCKTQTVYAVHITDEKLDNLPDIKIGAEISDRIFRDIKEGKIDTNDALSKKALDFYYKSYFQNRETLFGYPIKNSNSVFQMLTCNKQGFEASKENKNKRQVLPFAFESAGKAFSVIDNRTTEVIVEGYNDISRQLVADYETAPLDTRYKLLRHLGKFSLSLFDYQFDLLKKKGALRNCGGDNGILVMADGFYNNKIGLDLDGNKTALIC